MTTIDENSVLGRGPAIDRAALVLAATAAMVVGFLFYTLPRVNVFSPQFSWDVFWSCSRAIGICGAAPLGAGIGALLLRREFVRRRLAESRISGGRCPACSYAVGVPGLGRCPECGHTLAAPTYPRLPRIGPRPILTAVAVLVIACLAGGLCADAVLRADERVFLNEAAAITPPKPYYHRARAWPSSYGFTARQGTVTLTD